MLVVLAVFALLAGATVISVIVVATRGGRSVADSAKCLVEKGLIATPGTIHVPKGVVVTKANVATGTVSTNKRAFDVPELDVIGAESAVMAGNHAVIFFTGDQDVQTGIQTGTVFRKEPAPGFYRPSGFPQGAYYDTYLDRPYIIAWDETPTHEQEKLVESCLR
jgi:hypothetical protein